MPILLTLSALLAVQQHPAPPPPPPGAHPDRPHVVMIRSDGPGGLDKDGDGQVSREEFAAPMNDHFARMDKDGDGRLSTEELAVGQGPGAHEVMIRRGPGGPGMRPPGGPGEHNEERTMVIVGEPGADGRREIVIHGGPEGPDGPHGAEVRRETWGAWSARMVQGPGRGPDSTGAPPRVELRRAEGPDGEPRVMVFSGPEGLAELGGAFGEGGPGQRIEIVRVGGPGSEQGLDTDNDGKISEAEFTNPLREAFSRMDADHSGFIEEGERGGNGDSRVIVHRIQEGGDHD